jgi:hypothetical protein
MTRRASLMTLGAMGLAGFTALTSRGVAEAKKKKRKKCGPCRTKKKGKCKKQKPDGTPCEDGGGLCQDGSCGCGGGPVCPSREVCQAELCFPQGTCPAGTQTCVPETGTLCGDGCYCAQSAEGHTVCIESGGLCFLPTTCETSADCATGQACVDFSGCCSPPLGSPFPPGTKVCADPCAAPTV